MKKIVCLLAASVMVLAVTNCKPKELNDQQGTKIVKKWFKALAQVSEDCKQQKVETLDAVLQEAKIEKPRFLAWKQKSMAKFQEAKQQFKDKFCKKEGEEGKKKKKKKKKKK
jgi:hypothetical protein